MAPWSRFARWLLYGTGVLVAGALSLCLLVLGVGAWAVLAALSLVMAMAGNAEWKKNRYHSDRDSKFLRTNTGLTFNLAFRPKTHMGSGGGLSSGVGRGAAIAGTPWPWSLLKSFSPLVHAHRALLPQTRASAPVRRPPRDKRTAVFRPVSAKRAYAAAFWWKRHPRLVSERI